MRQVVEAEGAQVEGSGRSGAGSCPQSITRENKKFKKLKSKRKENKERQAPAPPPYLFWVRPCFGQMVRGARRSCAELAHLEAGRAEQLDTRHTTSVHAGNAASRMQTKARACQQPGRISAERPRKPLALAQKSEQEPPATDCDSRGQTRCSELSRQFDRHGAPGSFWPS